MNRKRTQAALSILLAWPAFLAAQTTQIQITFTNAAPAGGAWIMRPWVGLNDGNFPTFTVGQPAAPGIQHIAEDGVTGDLANMLPPGNACSGVAAVYNASLPCQYQIFNSYANHGQQASLGNPTAPGKSITWTFTVNKSDANSQFLSYIGMVIPSNDAFFGSDTAHPIQLFKNGAFNGGAGPITIPVMFSDVFDAGTEVNTGSAADTAFLGQAVNGTGTHPDSNSVIHPHPSFVDGIVNGSNMFGGTLNTFTKMNNPGPIASITIQEVRQVQISIMNTAPKNGLWIMRPWVGLHDGKFTTFTAGQAAPSGVQHIAEDGVTGDPANTLPPSNVCTGVASVYSTSAPCQYDVFNAYANHGQQASLGNPTPPGNTLSWTFPVNPNDPNSQFLSLVGMVVPSNDAFFGTDTAHPVALYKNGIFNGGNGPIRVAYNFSDLLDAGTEVNTGSPADTAFLGQAVNGTGTHPDTNSLIHTHDPFLPSLLNGSNMFGGILNTFPLMNAAGQVVSVVIQEVSPSVTAVVNAASQQAGPVAPGEIVVVRGQSVGPASLVAADLPGGSLPATVSGTSVWMNGLPAPMIYASGTQTSFQVPYGISGASSAQLVLSNGIQTPLSLQVPVAASAPGLFTSDFTGNGRLVALNMDGSVNSPSNPAARGSAILLFATGEGMTNPAGQEGTVETKFIRQPVLPVSVALNGIPASVIYAGSSPGTVSGVMEIEVALPASLSAGLVAVNLQVGTVSSSSAVSISVK
jgi:uncharacterized protein (TIGR03437 family)